MAEESTLDDFLTGTTSNVLSDSKGAASAPQVVARPKLKKIKRAKIRPSSDIPPAPQKVNPDEFTSSIAVQPDNISSDESIRNTNILETSQAVENPIKEEEILNTSLVTAADAQNMTALDSENSYALDEIPPELDYAMDDSIEDEYIDNGNYVKKSAIYLVSFIFLFIGLLLGKIFFSEKKIENRGLEGVVANPDTPAGRPRCGLTDKNQACIFYVLNWYKQELNGRDFYKLAAQLTGREEYMIESENMHYANVKIKPGHFAQLNIPALK